MTTKRILLIVSTVGSFLLVAAAIARPQTLDPPSQISCPDEIDVGEDVRTSRICPEYDKKKTCAGDQDVPLKITITGLASLKLLGVSLAEQSVAEQPVGEQPVPITFSPVVRTATKATVPPAIEYTCKMNINTVAKARKYQVKLKLQYPNEKPFFEYFSLKVCAAGGIRISDDSPKVITGYTGREAAFRLKLLNAFENYAVNIREIRIRANPAELIEPREKSIPYPTSIKHQEDNPVDISFKLAKMSAQQVFRGFDADSKILLDFVYDDGEDRVLHDSKEIKLDLKADWTVLVMAILFGVLAGCLVKISMQYLQKTKQISRKDQIRYLLGTAAVGIVLSLVALFGKVQVIAFKLEGSYDDPRVLFIASLAVTISAQLIVPVFFKVPKSGESQLGDKAMPKTGDKGDG